MLLACPLACTAPAGDSTETTTSEITGSAETTGTSDESESGEETGTPDPCAPGEEFDNEAPLGDVEIAYVRANSHLVGTWCSHLFGVQADGSDNHGVYWVENALITEPTWSPTGEHLAFVVTVDAENDGQSQIFSKSALGEVTNVSLSLANDHDFDWSPDGTRIAFVSERDENPEIYVVDRDGTQLVRVTDRPEQDYSPRWSPDGTQIAFISTSPGLAAALYVVSSQGGNAVEVPQEPGTTAIKQWWPHEDILVNWYDKTAIPSLYTIDPSGTPRLHLAYTETANLAARWSSDASKLAFVDSSSGMRIVNADGNDEIEVSLFGALDAAPTWSPDGSKIAFTSCRYNTNWEIYTSPATGGGVVALTDELDWDHTLPTWRP